SPKKGLRKTSARAHGSRISVRCQAGVAPAEPPVASTRTRTAVVARISCTLTAAILGLSSDANAGIGCAVLARVALVALVALPAVAHAHPLAPAVLEIHELGDGRADVGWKMPLARPRGAELEPLLPARCRTVEPATVAEDGSGVWTRWRVACGPEGLVGERIGVTGPGSI